MFTFDMIFSFRSDSEESSCALSDFLCCLSGSNQIIFETLNISGSESKKTARVSVPFMDSLDEKYYDAYTKETFQRLSTHLRKPMDKIFIGEDFTYSENFSLGKDTKYYVLTPHWEFRDMSPICCGETGDHIPYYLLPKLTNETTTTLTAWETNYAAYDRLFYVTGIGERSAHKMLSDINSPLNQKGLSVCRTLENELHKPVYYYLYRFYGKQPKKCPICGEEWKQSEDSLFNFKCDKCKLTANKTPNE